MIMVVTVIGVLHVMALLMKIVMLVSLKLLFLLTVMLFFICIGRCEFVVIVVNTP